MRAPTRQKFTRRLSESKILAVITVPVSSGIAMPGPSANARDHARRFREEEEKTNVKEEAAPAEDSDEEEEPVKPAARVARSLRCQVTDSPEFRLRRKPTTVTTLTVTMRKT